MSLVAPIGDARDGVREPDSKQPAPSDRGAGPFTIRPDVHERFLRVKDRALARVAHELASIQPDRERYEFGRDYPTGPGRKAPRELAPFAEREDGPQGWNDDDGE